MIARFLFLLSFFIFFSACTDSTKETDSISYDFLHKGKFKYEGSSPGLFLVDRHENYQDEYITYFDMDVRFNIEWLNDSMYEMRFDSILTNPNNIDLYSDIHKLVKTCIVTDVTDSSYTEKATNNLHPRIEYTRYDFLK